MQVVVAIIKEIIESYILSSKRIEKNYMQLFVIYLNFNIHFSSLK